MRAFNVRQVDSPHGRWVASVQDAETGGWSVAYADDPWVALMRAFREEPV
jgi:hypothetical protein